MVRRILACAAFALVGGCSLLTSLEGLSTGGDGTPTPGGSDGGGDSTTSTDGGGTDDARADGGSSGDAAVDSGNDSGPPPPNLHVNGTFETSSDPWTGFQGTIALDDTERSGTRSLRACGSAGFDYYTADDTSAFVGPVLGATYRAEGWVRAAPGAGSTPPNVHFTIRSVSFTPAFQSIESDFVVSAALTATWQKVSITMKITKAAERLGIYVGADYTTGSCFLLDDVTLQRID